MSSAVQQPSQNASPAQLAPITAKKLRRSRKAPAIKAEVITRRIHGQSKRSISRDLQITANTVDTILEESHIEAHLKLGQQRTAGLVSSALDVIEKRLAQNSENAAIKLLDATIWPLQERAGRAKPDTILNLAISNLIAAPSNSGSSTVASNETTHNTQVVDITPVSKS